MQLKTLDTLLKKIKPGQKVVVRADLDVPFSDTESGRVVKDATRLIAATPTIIELSQAGAVILVMGHIGRPGGEFKKDLSTKLLLPKLEELLSTDLIFSSDCIGKERAELVSTAKPGTILLLENTRFHSGEKKNDPAFSQELAKDCDFFVNDAFATAHRAHASTVGVTELLPSYAGKHLENEVTHWDQLVTNPARPFVVLVGGLKISDKITAVEKLTELADAVLVGGGVANNFIKAEGHPVYNSFTEEPVKADTSKTQDFVEVADEMLEKTEPERIIINDYIPLPKIIYPTDVIAATSIDSNETEVVELTSGKEVPNLKDKMYLDIGPKTQKLYSEVIRQAATIFWNGPMGVFENEKLVDGTAAVAKAIANSAATSIIGGGDTIAAIKAVSNTERFDYISSAGGASLEYLSGKLLPGLAPLQEKNSQGSDEN